MKDVVTTGKTAAWIAKTKAEFYRRNQELLTNWPAPGGQNGLRPNGNTVQQDKEIEAIPCRNAGSD